MPTSLTPEQVAAVNYNAGFRGDELVTATAISLRESGGKPWAYNGNLSTGDQSYGLFQLNLVGNMGPSRLKAWNLTSGLDLFDPLNNARAAYALAHANSIPFYAWGPYKGQPATTGTNVPAALAAVQRAQASGLLGRPVTYDATAYRQAGGQAVGALGQRIPTADGSSIAYGLTPSGSGAGGPLQNVPGATSGDISNAVGQIGGDPILGAIGSTLTGWVGDLVGGLGKVALIVAVVAAGAGLVVLGLTRTGSDVTGVQAVPVPL